MRSLIVATAILALVSAVDAGKPRWSELTDYSFQKYCDDFGRMYKGEEWDMRKNIFDAELKTVNSHNQDKTQTWKQGVNQFSDWTKAEKKAYNSFKAMKSEDKKKLQTYKSNRNPAEALPKTVDYRTHTSPFILTGVKNQGACGGCWGFSATETVESQFALLTGQLPVLSVQQVISCTTTMYGCGGGDYFYGWMYLASSSGFNEQWLYPFTDFFSPNETKAGTAACKNITKEFLPNFPWYPKAGVTDNIMQVTSNNASALMEALALAGPQSIAVSAEPWMGYEGGIFQNNNSAPGEWQLDHAVQAVGYGYDFDTDMDYWIVRNSWGTEWGELGFIRLSRPKVEPCGVDQGQVACGTSGLLSQPGYVQVSVLNKTNV